MKTAEIVSFSERAMEGVLVEGVTATLGEAKITLRLHDLSGVQVQVFGALAGAGIVVDVIVQVPGPDGLVHLTFTVPGSKLRRALQLLERNCADICRPENTSFEENLSKVSLVGVGMRSHAGVALRMFELLGENGIRIHLISTSEIRISCLIDTRFSELAVRALQDGFRLGGQAPNRDVREG
jgi:aspartate kinase